MTPPTVEYRLRESRYFIINFSFIFSYLTCYESVNISKNKTVETATKWHRWSNRKATYFIPNICECSFHNTALKTYEFK